MKRFEAEQFNLFSHCKTCGKEHSFNEACPIEVRLLENDLGKLLKGEITSQELDAKIERVFRRNSIVHLPLEAGELINKHFDKLV